MQTTSPVQSLDRTFEIIEGLCNSRNGLTISEITKATDLNKSTVHRILSALIVHGYADKDENSRYHMTLKLYRLSSKVIDNMDLVQMAKQQMEHLSKISNETVHLVVPNGTDIVYIYKVEAENGAIRMFSRIGMRRPMYCTGVGKAIMAFRDRDEQYRIWLNSNITAYTEHTITDFHVFENELKQINKDGYAYDNEENEIGIRCIAVPIRDYTGKVCSALSISAPVSRMDNKRIEEIRPLIVAACNNISKLMGYTISI